MNSLTISSTELPYCMQSAGKRLCKITFMFILTGDGTGQRRFGKFDLAAR